MTDTTPSRKARRGGRFAKLYADRLQDDRLPDLLDRNSPGKAAWGVHCLALMWQAVSQRDGYIPRSVLRSGLHGTASDARLLVETGWWEEAPGGWQIVGYAEDNETAADIAARSLEGLISQCKRWMRQGKHCCCGHHSDTGELVGDPVGDLIAGGDRRA